MRRSPLFVITAALCLAVTPAFSQAPSPQTTPPDKIDPDPIAPQAGAARDEVGVPAKVWAVRVVGGWEADGKKGFSRLIGTFETGGQKLTVQRLAEPDGRVVATKTLDDEEAGKLTFGDFRAEPEDSGGVTMFLDTIPDRDGLRDTWVLVVGAQGEARFGPATN